MIVLATLPLSVRLLAVCLVGMALGSVMNWAIYRLAWNWRDISPWGPAPEGVPQRSWADRIPVLGWLRLRREHAVHGRGYWLRPMAIELTLGVGLAVLYWWEIARQGLIVQQVQEFFAVVFGGPIPPLELPLVSSEWAHAIFFGHAVLIGLMTAASFIDIDEKIIPDEVTVPGTLLGLVLMTLMPQALLPHVDIRPAAPIVGELVKLPPALAGANLYVEPVTLAAPNAWPQHLSGWWGLVLGQACWWLWCFALAPRTWRGRRGVAQAIRVILRRVVRELTRAPLGPIAWIGSAAILAVWWFGQASWVGLLSSLVGMAVSGGIVWVVRLVGTGALGREAMGFGDVTLMMMVGTYVGWQAGVLIFFVAPFAALLIGILQLVLKRDHVIPYGPFLCLGTLVVVADWTVFWSRHAHADELDVQYLFGLGWVVPVVLLVSFALMGALLIVWRRVKIALFGSRENQ
jgi:leader peptidase (prepilin peptidase) / N-methyltransferase